MKRVNVAIAGLGGVGRAIADLLFARQERYRTVYSVDVRLVSACGSRAGVADPDGLTPDQLDQLVEGQSGIQFLFDAKPDVLFEAGPSNYKTGLPGLSYISGALAAGIHAIVISKGALVLDGPGLKERAAAAGALIRVSGAAGAALPAMDLLNHSLKGCTIRRIDGILNATTNYLLTAMMKDGLGFEEALSRAKKEGFAEADPRNDIEGWDTASKMFILGNFGLDAEIKMDKSDVNGIQNINAVQIQAWKSEGKTPKLLGSLIRYSEKDWRVNVGVQTFSDNDMFAHVSGKNKAVRIYTDEMGEVFCMGCGTEPTATAAAALKDFEHILETTMS